MATVCVTGGTGFIGTHLVRALLKRGDDVRVFDYPAQDLCCLGQAEDFIFDNQPEIVFHLAAQAVVTQEDDLVSLSTNIRGTYNLYHACLSCPSIESIVHVSTDKVYGENENAIPDSPLIGFSHPYETSKLCGDALAQMYAAYYRLPIRIIRTGNIYGGGDLHEDRLIPQTIFATLEGRAVALRSNGLFVRDYIYVQDLTPAYLKIAMEPEGIYNLGGEPHAAIDVVLEILRQMDRLDLVPVVLNNQHNEISKQHVTGCPSWWKPAHSLQDGLQKTIAWYKEFVDEHKG